MHVASVFSEMSIVQPGLTVSVNLQKQTSLFVFPSLPFPFCLQCTLFSPRHTPTGMSTPPRASSSFMFWKESILRGSFRLTPSLVCSWWRENKEVNSLNFSFYSVCIIQVTFNQIFLTLFDMVGIYAKLICYRIFPILRFEI